MSCSLPMGPPGPLPQSGSSVVNPQPGFLQGSFLPKDGAQHFSLLNLTARSSSLTQSLGMAALSLRLPPVWHHLQAQSECTQSPSPASDKGIKQIGPGRDPCGAPLVPACQPFTHLVFSKPDLEYRNTVGDGLKSLAKVKALDFTTLYCSPLEKSGQFITEGNQADQAGFILNKSVPTVCRPLLLVLRNALQEASLYNVPREEVFK